MYRPNKRLKTFIENDVSELTPSSVFFYNKTTNNNCDRNPRHSIATIKKIQDIHFLNRCKRNNIIPNFIKNKINLSSDLLKNKTVSRHSKSLTFSILNNTIRNHRKDLHLLRNQILKKKAEMSQLDSETKGIIDDHLTKCFDRLKQSTKSKLIRKFQVV